MSKKTISLNKILKFQDIKNITMRAFNITSQDFDLKYYPVKNVIKNSGHKGHSAGGIGNSGRKYATPSLNVLYSKWYASRDPNWLYSHPEYFWEGLACSWEVSAPKAGSNIAKELLSPKTNKYIQSHPHMNIEYIEPIDTFNLEWNIFDWGAGVGLTTLLLSQNFPKSTIYYSGTPCSGEVKFFKEAINYLSAKGFDFSNIKIIYLKDHDLLPPLDLLVGIEIVEHFTHPMKFLEPLLEKVKIGGMFAHSSYWNSEKKMPTLGHFLEYKFDSFKGFLYSDKDIHEGKSSINLPHGSPGISAAWHKSMKNRKWKKLKNDPFFHKPVFWQKTIETLNCVK